MLLRYLSNLDTTCSNACSSIVRTARYTPAPGPPLGTAFGRGNGPRLHRPSRGSPHPRYAAKAASKAGAAGLNDVAQRELRDRPGLTRAIHKTPLFKTVTRGWPAW